MNVCFQYWIFIKRANKTVIQTWILRTSCWMKKQFPQVKTAEKSQFSISRFSVRTAQSRFPPSLVDNASTGLYPFLCMLNDAVRILCFRMRGQFQDRFSLSPFYAACYFQIVISEMKTKIFHRLYWIIILAVDFNSLSDF